MSATDKPDAFTRRHLRAWLSTQAPIEPGIDPERYAVAIERYLDENDEWERAQFEGWAFIFRAMELEGGDWFSFDYDDDLEGDCDDGDDYWEDHDVYGGGAYCGDECDEW